MFQQVDHRQHIILYTLVQWHYYATIIYTYIYIIYSCQTSGFTGKKMIIAHDFTSTPHPLLVVDADHHLPRVSQWTAYRVPHTVDHYRRLQRQSILIFWLYFIIIIIDIRQLFTNAGILCHFHLTYNRPETMTGPSIKQ